MSLGRATPNMIVYGNDFRNGINRSVNKRIQDKTWRREVALKIEKVRKF